LRDAKCGQTVKVLKRRIMDMGITKINVRGYELSLRKSAAEMIEVE